MVHFADLPDVAHVEGHFQMARRKSAPRRYGGRNGMVSGVKRLVSDTVVNAGIRAAKRAAVNVLRNTAAGIGRRASKSTQTGFAGTRRRGVRSAGRSYRTRGYMRPKFKKRVYSRVNKFLTSGAVLKEESKFAVNDPDCVYVGYNTMPTMKLYDVLMMSVIRKFAKMIGRDLNNWEQVVTGSTGWIFRIMYQSAPDAAMEFATFTSSVDTSWIQLAIDLGNLILAAVDPGDLWFHLDTIDLDCGSANDRYIIRAPDLWIKIVANANLNIQNRTLATTGTGDESSMLDVANNPLRGKMYRGYGQAWPFKFNNQPSPGTIKALQCNARTGGLFLNANDTGNTAEMRQNLSKPPVYTAFQNCYGSRYVSLDPGAIRRSKTVHYEDKSLNGWMSLLLPDLRSAVTIANWPSVGYVNIGKQVVFGLEKLLDSGNVEPDVSVGCELVMTISGIAYYKRKLVAEPLKLG